MTWLKTIAAETIGLFVDDGRFAIAIAVWLLLAGSMLQLSPLSQSWNDALFVAGLAAILIGGAAQAALPARPKK